jgi:uncharacterized membrane protein
MRLSRLGTRQGAAGLLFMAIGTFALREASRYPIGTARRMGPGLFPSGIAALLILAGAIAVVQSLLSEDADRIERAAFRTLFFLTAGIVAFGLLIEHAGLVAAVLGLVLLSCHDRLRRQYFEVALIFLALSALVVGLFVYALGLPIEPFS